MEDRVQLELKYILTSRLRGTMSLWIGHLISSPFKDCSCSSLIGKRCGFNALYNKMQKKDIISIEINNITLIVLTWTVGTQCGGCYHSITRDNTYIS